MLSFPIMSSLYFPWPNWILYFFAVSFIIDSRVCWSAMLLVMILPIFSIIAQDQKPTEIHSQHCQETFSMPKQIKKSTFPVNKTLRPHPVKVGIVMSAYTIPRLGNISYHILSVYVPTSRPSLGLSHNIKVNRGFGNGALLRNEQHVIKIRSWRNHKKI